MCASDTSCYTRRVTTTDVIAHWRKGSKDALEAASLLAKDGKYELALFHCHLAVEKALKASVMEKTGKPHPKVHNLNRLALLLHDGWADHDCELFDTLSEFAIAAWYDDPDWAVRYATAANARLWIDRTAGLLSTHAL
jgi:HEPN domain-containing protein